jgi:hypothetical protein
MTQDTLTQELVDFLNQKLELNFTQEQWLMVFFLTAKSEHDIEDPDLTFSSHDKRNVFFYCEALSYDYRQRGCTFGLVGFTTGGTEAGDAPAVFKAYHELGGPDLLEESKVCHTDKAKAKVFCQRIHALEGDQAFVQAQLDVLCSPEGYMYEAVKAIRKLDISVSPLFFAAVYDSMLNFGLGGKWCPKKFLQHRGIQGKHVQSLKDFLVWKRRASCKNNHNSCKHNGLCRANMYKSLLKKQGWDLPLVKVEKVVHWAMK